MNSISITGCRHDIFGHQLKAIGLLRALATCADPKYRDPEAEGWWDLERACFHLRSYKYPNEEQLMEFFSQHYQPTAIFSPWNTGGGFDEQREVLITFSKIETNKKGISKPCKPTKHDTNRLITFLWRNRGILKSSGLKVRDKVKALRAEIPTTGEFSFVLKAIGEPTVAKPIDGITIRVRVKTSSKKDVIAILERDHHDRPDIVQGIKISRRFFDAFRRANSSDDMLLTFESLREQLPEQSSTAMDAILTTRTSRASDNPLFLNRGKGEGGNDELFRTFWNYFLAFRKHPFDYAVQCLFGRGTLVQLSKKQKEGIGTPFFPDAIKTYNHGLSWVVGTFSFNALDYLLAVEGAMVMRGAVSRALASNSRRFAAFPFIFDNGEDLTDGKQVVGTASSLWLPLWTRPVTFAELASFICDAQARLPGKEAWFSSEFARALRVQGVDAGFVGWQEFRFKMKASRVPWVCTGQYLGPTADRRPLQLNDALGPLDESRFLSQFEPRRKGNKIDSRSPHRVGAAINSAIEDTVAAPTPQNAIGILSRLYDGCERLAQSKSFQETLPRPPSFFNSLPQKSWEALLEGMHSPEFRIARALASIVGFSKQANAEYSGVQPLLGSLLPLKRGQHGWYLPDSKDRTKQAVWSGTDLWHDAARVLSRRYLDSLNDERPAIVSPRPAPLADILALLNGELDDHMIARWTEALSLIGWHLEKADQVVPSKVSGEDESRVEADSARAVPLAYAALRSLLEVESEWQGGDPSLWQRRRSQRAIALLCQRVPSSLGLSVEDALHQLSVWGVPNSWSTERAAEKPRLKGQDVIDIDHRKLDFSGNSLIVNRLAAAVLVPLDWRDRWTIFRAVTLPQNTNAE